MGVSSDFLSGNRGVHFTFADESWLLWVWFYKLPTEIKPIVSEMCPLHDTMSLCPRGMQLPVHSRDPSSSPALKRASNAVMIRGGPAVTRTIRTECQVPIPSVPWEWAGSKVLWDLKSLLWLTGSLTPLVGASWILFSFFCPRQASNKLAWCSCRSREGAGTRRC